MLGLKMATDPRWVNIVEKNIEEILIDHAYCEQKAASNAISLMVNYPDFTDLVTEMTLIAQEEIAHFGLVHNKLLERGYTLGSERRDPYVNDLRKFIRKGGSLEQNFVTKMLLGAMIEARSCERFKILSEEINDEDLRGFYRSLMESEARHYMSFIKLAKQYAPNTDVDSMWQEFLEWEAELVTSYGKSETMHG
jgi:tRNA-(ms[2]io[6]A)-hydroxylase